MTLKSLEMWEMRSCVKILANNLDAHQIFAMSVQDSNIKLTLK